MNEPKEFLKNVNFNNQSTKLIQDKGVHRNREINANHKEKKSFQKRNHEQIEYVVVEKI